MNLGFRVRGCAQGFRVYTGLGSVGLRGLIRGLGFGVLGTLRTYAVFL